MSLLVAVAVVDGGCVWDVIVVSGGGWWMWLVVVAGGCVWDVIVVSGGGWWMWLVVVAGGCVLVAGGSPGSHRRGLSQRLHF